MVAIRAGQQEMAEFLIDNGIDWTFEAKLVVSTIRSNHIHVFFTTLSFNFSFFVTSDVENI